MSNEYKQLCAAFESSNSDLDRIGELVKICILQSMDVPISREYQNVLEIGCLWAAHSRDGLSFERYFCQLSSTIYFAAGQSLDSVAGDRKWLLIGLQLLNLLVTGRTAEFHILMEQLPESHLLTNPFIIYPLKLEQSLIEGTYNRIWEAKQSAPAVEYGWFVDGLVDNIRNELIHSMEHSMTSVSVDELAKLLVVDRNDMQSISSVASQRGWHVNGNDIVISGPYQKAANLKSNSSSDLGKVLEYSHHLEQII